jgi:hypothetical protein
MVKSITREHLEAVNRRTETTAGLNLRAEYCDFMSQTLDDPVAERLWAISAQRRREEAARL